MAFFDITVTAQSGRAAGNTGSSSFSEPGDFDGATIDSVAIIGSPNTVTSDGVTDDTIGVRFWIETTGGGADVYGSSGSDAASLCFASVGDSASSDIITDGASPSPGPTIAVGADWTRVGFAINYSANMKDDGETVSWSAFTIRVTYTPIPPPDLQQEHYRFATPITGAAHEAWTLVGSEDTSFEIVLDDDYALIVKLGNDGSASGFQGWQLEYNVDGGGWNAVIDSSSNVRLTASGDVDGALSGTERLTASARTFQASILEEFGGAALSSISNADSDVERYYAITFRSVDLSGGESIQFRVTTTESVTYDITPTATVPGGVHTVTVSGTITENLSPAGSLESQVLGSPELTIILTLDGTTWVPASGSPNFDDNRQAIIDGFDSDGIEKRGWNTEIRDALNVANVVRTSDTVVTITLDATDIGDYSIITDETITFTLEPSTHIDASASPFDTGVPPFTITAECSEVLPPDAIVTQQNLSGVVGDIDEPVVSPEGSDWLIFDPPPL